MARAPPPRTQDLIKKNFKVPRTNHYASAPICSLGKLSFTNSYLPVVSIATKMEKRLNGEPNVRLGRGSNVGGRGGGGCRIHESISHVRLGRSGDAKTARREQV